MQALLLAAAIAVASEQTQPNTIPEMWTAWCARCHAEDGSGRVNEPTVTVEPMDFTDCKVTSPEPDVDWERAIAKGGPGVGLSPQMPGFEDSLSADQITAFVSHLRTFCKDTGWPSGNTNFPRPILTEKAFPENEFLILPAVSHWDEDPAPSITESAVTAIYERRIGKRSMVEIEVPLVGTNSLTTWTRGLGDVAVSVKHALYARASSPLIFSAGLETVLPTGDRFKDHGSGTTIFEPFISAGAMLRDWYLQTEIKAELPADRVRADRAMVYNAYVGLDTSEAPNTWTLGVELNGETTFPLSGVGGARMGIHPACAQGTDGNGGARRGGGRDAAAQSPRVTRSAMGRLLTLGILGTLACAPLAHAQGSITGTVTTTAKGVAPVRVTIDQKVCGDQLPDEAIVVDAQGRLANAVVILSGVKRSAPAEATVMNEKCRFLPRVQLIAPKASITTTSKDAVLHTTNAQLENGRSLFNVALPMPGITITKAISAASNVRLSCSTHLWMRGWMVVTNEAAAISGADGRFTIDNVPPGTYELRVWHEALKGTPQKVTVVSGKPTDLSITLR